MKPKLTPRQVAVEKLYVNAKLAAADALGGARAYWIVGSTVRRMAVSAAVLQLLAQQDNSISDGTVRTLLEDLYESIVIDPDFQD
jgi:hypothetical protein